MHLVLQRREHTGRQRGPAYRLTALADLDRFELALLDHHVLRPVELWVSPAALGYEGQAERAFDAANAIIGWSWGDIIERSRLNADGLQFMSLAAREPRLTVNDIITGFTLEAVEVAELTMVERGVREAFLALQKKLETLDSYGLGDDILVEPDSPDTGVPISAWLKKGVR